MPLAYNYHIPHVYHSAAPLQDYKDYCYIVTIGKGSDLGQKQIKIKILILLFIVFHKLKCERVKDTPSEVRIPL